MHALKGLVVALGVLIVVSFVLLVYGFYSKVVDSEGAALDGQDTADRAEGTRPFETRFPLPDGCTLVEMRPHGDRLYLRTGPEGLCERIVVIDTVTGREVGTFTFKP